jgi:preprotein translocase subunit SecE
MEAVKEENAIVAKPKEWITGGRDFFRDVSSEMRKVSWPPRSEVMGTTMVVIVATLVFSIYLWGCDVVFYKAIDLLFTKFGSGVGS